MESIRFHLLVPDEEVSAAAHGAQKRVPEVTGNLPDPDAHFLAPVVVILIAAGVAALAEFVMDIWQNLQGGVVLDMSTGSLNIRRDRNLPANYIVVNAKDGTVTVDTKDVPKDRIHQLIELVVGGVLKSAAEVAKAATDAGAQAPASATP